MSVDRKRQIEKHIFLRGLPVSLNTKRRKAVRRLPFSIDRERSSPLISQIAEGIMQAVQAGIYKPGDILPGFREIADELGASLIVVRAAFARLADEGFVCRRRGVGTIVLDSGKKPWRGHVVIASIEIRENHLISAMTGALRQKLMMAGYLVSFVPFGGKPGTYDFTHLESVLKGPVSFVVATSCSPKIEEFLSRFDIPYAVFGESRRAVCNVSIDTSEAVDAFVRHCVASKVRRVLEVMVGSQVARVNQALRRTGIECESWPIVRKGGIEEISCATLKAFYGRLSREGKSWLPDLIYFNDNFASQNALLALVESGVDIPGDVRFVTWSNAGEGPYWRKSLARIEIDPFNSGRIFADSVLRHLESGGGEPSFSSIKPVYIPGETFPS